jgi:lactate dehydrogenase-like 2-hydroxyacid dehydrogenase
MTQKKILYVYEERIPIELQKMVTKKMNLENFNFKKMTYKTQLLKQKKLFRWCDAVLFAPGRNIKEDVIKEAKNCKIFQLWSSGYEKFDCKVAQKYRIPVCTNGSQNNVAVAEHAIMLLLSLSKKIIHFNKITKLGSWKNNSHGLDLFELKNKNIGIFGLGRIGLQFAMICKTFGMNVYYYDLIRKKKYEQKYGFKYMYKNSILKNCQIFSLHLHLNHRTYHYLNSKNLKNIKKGSFIINVSRAELIERNSLIKFLKNGKLQGLGLDAHYVEPTKKNDKLLSLPNVICTPHTAGSTRDTYERIINICIDNIKTMLLKKKCKYRVV